LSKLNFLFKIALSFFLLGFAVWYEHLAYNLGLVVLLVIILRREKITLFRFPRQGYFFGILLLLMFLFRAFNGYGKILLQLPLNLALTDEGLRLAAIFITQVVLIFLLFGLAIYSTGQGEFFYYLKRLDRPGSRVAAMLQKLARIGLYALYLLPGSLDYRKTIAADLQSGAAENRASAVAKAKMALEQIYRFIYGILRRSEDEFGAFLAARQAQQMVRPPAVLNLRHLAIAVIVIGLHANLVWKGV